MNMHLPGIIRKSLMLISVASLLVGCADDTWDQHYSSLNNENVTNTLWAQLQTQDSLSDFREVLDSVRVMNGKKITSVRYSALLNEQFYTVFAPLNHSFNKDSLLALCATVLGNEQVEKKFVMSHLSRTPHSLSPYTNEVVKMLNGKYLTFRDSSIFNVKIYAPGANQLARNGVIHPIMSGLPYVRNVYEAAMELPEFSGMGAFLKRYEKDSLDASASLLAGVNDMGIPIYVDSVLIRKNDLLGAFGKINSEDSTYWMVAPTKAGWDAAYARISSYFNFGNIVGGDSLKSYWTNMALMSDMFFNKTLQLSPNDSLVAPGYWYKYPNLHVYHKPFAANGLLDGAVTIPLSNGKIYKTSTWAFNPEAVFFTPILAEAEYDKNIRWVSKDSFNVFQRQLYSDSISGTGYLEITPKTPSVQSEVTFSISNTLSGKYDVYAVLLPKNIKDPTDKRPNKFNAFITYNQANGTTPTTVQCKTKTGLTYFINKPLEVDSVLLGTVSFPSCNYRQTKVTVSLRLKSIVTQKEINAKTYTNQMLIDCLYLKPRQD